jgi:5-methylcytosine-specific restriction endonuclease McrA
MGRPRSDLSNANCTKCGGPRTSRAARCRTCASMARQKWREAHRDREREVSRNHYARHAEKMRAEAKEKYRRDPKAWMAGVVAWRGRNPVKVQEYAVITLSDQRARRAGVPSTLTLPEWRTIKRLWHGKCAYCGAVENIGVDHILPYSRGGANEASNAVLCCASCNSSKHNLTLEEWLPRKFGDRAAAILARFQEAQLAGWIVLQVPSSRLCTPETIALVKRALEARQ